MAQLINGRIQYSGGERLPTRGSPEYNLAVQDPVGFSNFKRASGGSEYTAEDESQYQRAAKNQGFNVQMSPNSPITSEVLAGGSGFNLPDQTTGTKAAGLSSTIDELTQKNVEQQQADKLQSVEAAKFEGEKNKLNTQKLTLAQKLFGSTGKTALQNEANATPSELGSSVNTATRELNAINNQILAESVSARRRIEEIEKVGGTQTGVSLKVRQIQKESTAKQADLAVIQLARQGDYTLAKEIADRKVDAVLEDEKNKIDALKFIYEENKDQFTKAEERQYQAMIKREERNLKQQEDDLNFISDLSLDALKNGAPPDIASKMRAAKIPEEAMNIGGGYVNKLARDKATRDNNINTLPASTQTRIQTVAGQFDAEQAVKNYQTTAEAIDSITLAGNSPTDDISRIYAFAKVMDPNSVVREGEYKTIQDYSTALFERTGKKLQRVFDNAGFLTVEARKFMQDTLNNRLSSSKKAYDNIYSEYGRRINKVTGLSDGTDYITDYSRAFSTPSSKPQADIQVKTYYSTRPDLKSKIDQMVQDGLTYDVILQAIEDNE